MTSLHKSIPLNGSIIYALFPLRLYVRVCLWVCGEGLARSPRRLRTRIGLLYTYTFLYIDQLHYIQACGWRRRLLCVIVILLRAEVAHQATKLPNATTGTVPSCCIAAVPMRWTGILLSNGGWWIRCWITYNSQRWLGIGVGLQSD